MHTAVLSQDYERKFVQPRGFVVTECAISNCKACLDKAYPKSRDDYTGCGLHTKQSDGLQYAYWYPFQSTTQVSFHICMYVSMTLYTLCCIPCAYTHDVCASNSTHKL